MHRLTALAWSELNVLTLKRYRKLEQRYGDLDTALAQMGVELLEEIGCKEETVRAALTRLAVFDPEKTEAELMRRGIQFFSFEDDLYPEALKQIEDMPVFLYARGDLEILKQPCIALVGTRGMTQYGRRVTQEFVPPIVAASVVTVSGLAEGVDSEVARQTLKAGGRTVGVVGHGLAMMYPDSNRELADEIVERGGLLLSEYPLREQPGKFTFPARNRIIAGLSLGTVVLEAPERSGAVITAELALDYRREVFAVPGQIFDENYAGCHRLIARGQAHLVTSPAEVLREVGIVASSSAQSESTYDPLTPEEAAVWALLTSMPQATDILAEKSGLQPSQIAAALTMMELNGAAKNIGNAQWVKT